MIECTQIITSGVLPMKRILAAVVLSTFAYGYAAAADLPPAPPRAAAAYIPIVAPVYNWSGIYVGINGGWGFGTAKWTAIGVGATATGSNSDNGGVVGGTLGVNWQAGAFVLGGEADFDYSGVNTGTSQTVCNIGITCQTGNNWLSTVRGRVGFAADRVLFYATAGGAFANVQTALNGVTTTHTRTGWTAGLGAEYAFADNWTAKIEYLYVDLGNKAVTCTATVGVCAPPAVGVGPINVQAGLTENLVRAGVNYKFNF
jgi:outer membrane immunogenic protein